MNYLTNINDVTNIYKTSSMGSFTYLITCKLLSYLSIWIDSKLVCIFLQHD